MQPPMAREKRDVNSLQKICSYDNLCILHDLYKCGPDDCGDYASTHCSRWEEENTSCQKRNETESTTCLAHFHKGKWCWAECVNKKETPSGELLSNTILNGSYLYKHRRVARMTKGKWKGRSMSFFICPRCAVQRGFLERAVGAQITPDNILIKPS